MTTQATTTQGHPQKIGALSVAIALATTVLIAAHLVLKYALHASSFWNQFPLWIVLVAGGGPLVIQLIVKAIRREFGADFLALISIVTSVILGQYLAGSIIVLMLSGGEALEAYALRNASSALRALARRMPSTVHRRLGEKIVDASIDEVQVDDLLVLFPHEVCPADGIVTEGHSTMDESFVTGEPFRMSKAPGVEVISGAINDDHAITIQVVRRPVDSRFAKIVKVMQRAESERPRMRRLADQLGAFYTPLAVTIAVIAWVVSGDPIRFLAVLVVATPCPLLIGIPVAIIGAISLCARRSIIVKDPAAMEQISLCRTAIFDKTGTLTYGRPALASQVNAPGFDAQRTLGLVASIERYSKHPLATAIIAHADSAGVATYPAREVHEPPGQGLQGKIEGHHVEITSRRKLLRLHPNVAGLLPTAGGLECFVLIDGVFAAAYQFRDEPRAEGVSFIEHLKPKHQFNRVMIVSGDRDSEVRYLARQMGIETVYSEQSPEQKVEIVRAETAKARTMYAGDGINDAPALASATVGIAIGNSSDVTNEASSIVILDRSLEKIDEFMHISRQMRRIALQCAIGGMSLSLGAMVIASFGFITPVAGALIQEAIDVVAVLFALQAAFPPKKLVDFDSKRPDSHSFPGKPIHAASTSVG